MTQVCPGLADIHPPSSEQSSVSIRNEMSKLKHEIRLRTVRKTQADMRSKADSFIRPSSTRWRPNC
jgi:hypothetical protein